MVGKRLAEILKTQFIDLDDIIEKKEGRKIKDIFSSDGEPYFRQKEKEAVYEVSKKNNMVVATGGGVVVNPGNLKLLKESGALVCLAASPKVIFERTRNQDDRPLLNVNNPEEKIKILLEKRIEFYAQADYTIDTSSKSVEEVAREIIGKLKISSETKKFFL